MGKAEFIFLQDLMWSKTVFLVRLGTSSLSATCEEYGETNEKFVPSMTKIQPLYLLFTCTYTIY